MIAFILLSGESYSQTSWQSRYVKVGSKGMMKYVSNKEGNRLPDFSRVGYYHGHRALPTIATLQTIRPNGTNDQQNIQDAIDDLGKRPLDKNGFRGAIVLQAGHYNIPGTIKIAKSGIVLRGEGTATKLIAIGKGQRTTLSVSGNGNPVEVKGTRTKIKDTFLPLGATSFTVDNVTKFSVGDRIMVYRPGTEEWIAALQMNRINQRDSTIKQWTAHEYDLHFEREIVEIKGNRITIDNPIVMAIDAKFGGGEIYRYDYSTRIENVGVENLSFQSEYSSNEDEDHGWIAVSFNRIENGWVKNVESTYYGYSCVNLGDQSKNITVTDCRCLDAKSKITGGRRYSFNNDGQQNLVMNCYAREGRHDYVTGARVRGPNVFYNCIAENTHADIGPHHRWAVGTLYDNIVTDGEINIQDRGDWGTGHGWAGGNQVLWNCTAAKAAVQDPWVSAHNYAIGLKGKKYEGRLSGRPDGQWEGNNQPGLQPHSLFASQVRAAKLIMPASSTTMMMKQDMVQDVITTLRKQVLSTAAWALQQEPQTVTSFPAERSAGGLHDFYSEGDYWWPDSTGADKPYVQRDGETNPDNFTAHREAMIRFSRIVGALASAYKITGDKKYAAAILKHCRAWFVDPRTRMNPSLLYAQAIKGRSTGRGIGIIDTIQLMEVVQALLTIIDAKAMDAETNVACRNWFAEYLEWLTTHQYGKDEMNALNNHGTCWVMQVAVFARYTNNQVLLDTCRQRFKNILLPQQMANDGSFPRELARTKPFGYSLFNLDAMATICQVLSSRQDDLWNYDAGNGRTVKKAITFMYPYIKDKSSWPYRQDVMYWKEWPVAQPALVFAANRFHEKEWFVIWQSLDHQPANKEVIRNLPVRNPIIWF